MIGAVLFYGFMAVAVVTQFNPWRWHRCSHSFWFSWSACREFVSAPTI